MSGAESAAPCSAFAPRTPRDTTNCACGWSKARHEETAARAPGYYLLDEEHDPGLLRYGAPIVARTNADRATDPDADRCFNGNHPRSANGVCLLDGGRS